jgi:hypothetical protein
MVEEFARKVVAQFTGEIASRLTDHAFETLLDIETLMFEATALLNAASIVNRSDRREERSG